MIATPVALFGYVGYLCRAQQGEHRDTLIGDPHGIYRGGYYYFTRGCARMSLIETGEVIQDRVPGFLNLEHPGTGFTTGGTLRMDYVEDTEWLCIPSRHPRNKILPDLESVVLANGSTVNLVNGTNFYLVSGQIVKNSKLFQGPCALRIRSGDVELQAQSQVYGLKVRSLL